LLFAFAIEPKFKLLGGRNLSKADKLSLLITEVGITYGRELLHLFLEIYLQARGHERSPAKKG
jgi:hypothetical protein